MDKRKATLTLTEKLNELGCISMVTDPAVKSYLLSNAKSVVLDLKKSGRIVTHCIESYSFDISKLWSDTIKADSLPYNLRDYKTANYFFIEKHYDSSGSSFFATPASIVGEAEEKVLRESIYKNVPESVLKAFEVLEIPNFIDAYSIYSSLKGDEARILELGIYRPFKKEDKIELGDIIKGSKSGRYYLVDKIKSDGSIEGYRFQDEALKTPATGEKDDHVHSDCNIDYIIPFKKRFSDTNFFDFIFSLPYEDQNIEINKTILKESINIDRFSILQKEYSTGKYFKDYFSVLNREVQETVVEKIKSFPNQNTLLNSWIFNQGFDVKMSHLELYKTNTQSFITYFERSEKCTQEVIVSDLFNCDHINKDVIAFLEKKYAHLLRDVSFKKETSVGEIILKGNE